MTFDDQTLLLLNAYHDGELSPGEALAMEGRLAAEPELRAFADNLKALSASLDTLLPGERMPDSARSRILANLDLDDPLAEAVTAPVAASAQVAVGGSRSWFSLAAALLCGVVIGGLAVGGFLHFGNGAGNRSMRDAIVAAHLRSLIAPQPFDVASSDKHVVKPWFNGRTTIAPTAPDLADKGYPLAGGRVDIVDGKPVPTLVYRHDRHVISVTIVPKSDQPAAESASVDGSNIRRWTSGDLTYWAVSDLNDKDLASFVDLFKEKVAQGG